MLLIGDTVQWMANGNPCKGLVYTDQETGDTTVEVLTLEINGKRAKVMISPSLKLVEKL